MSQEGILSLLTACRSVKHSSSSFKAKILHRPFQAVISVLAKVDWSRTKEISTLQRDHLFEMVKLSIDATNLNSWPSYTQKPKEIVAIKTRLLRAGLCVPLFTEKQKVILLNTAGLPCPKDLIVYVYTPEEGVENEFLKYSSSTPHRLRKPSTETVVGVIPYSPPDSSPSSTAYRNLRHRADQADQVISLLQNDLHSMTLKYQNTIFELDRVEEGYKNLKREFEYVKGYSKSLKGGRDTLGLQEPSPGIDTVRSTNPFDMDRLAGHPSPSPSYTSRRLQSFDGDTRANQYSLFEEVGESSEYTNHWRKWIELIL